jgi:hypothetical protein|tara:strand:- start:476 stop:847 length:372 start_codon:yes stop_codon:yes gene_type:complete
MVYSYIVAIILMFIPAQIGMSGGKLYEPKDDRKQIYGYPKDYTRKQKIQRGTIEEKKYTTCRLMKTLKSKHTGRQACIYRGGNKTYTLMYEDNCPKQYKCVYNPGGTEPNIDDVIDSLNSIKK